MKSRVIRQGPCPKCGSSDAFTEYSDGGAWCFSCRTLRRSDVSGYVLERKQQEDESNISLPNDLSNEYGEEAVKWVDQYGLKPSDLIRANVKWSERRKQLLFIYNKLDGLDIGCIQGRNFSGGTKYHNQGDVHDVMPIYYYNNPTEASTIVLVEDAISAIKVSKDVWVDAMPLLGCSLPLNKITFFSKRGYSRVVVWLDHDKYREALNIAEKIRYTGLQTRVVTTDLDPKCYDADTIAKQIGII